MKNGIYNKSLYWPKEMKEHIERITERPWFIWGSQHYFDKAYEIGVPRGCFKAALFGEVVEAEIRNGTTKIVTRLNNRLNPEEDLCFAILFDMTNLRAFVKTVWINRKNDSHVSLRSYPYVLG